jgi:F0F1-type ATP synthase membrane subunit c/vacuolar-type H+-ATPase subunit K
MLLVLAGTTLFLLARNGLASIPDGTQSPPTGFSTWVQRADYFSAQSSLGLAMIGAGVAVGVWAAIRHVMRRRTVHGSIVPTTQRAT